MAKENPADNKKLKALLRALKEHPEGLWVRELAREARLDKSTVSRYLARHLKDKVNSEFWGRNKVIKLV
jgi:DNA-binding MarR family transcriptional regulator